MRELEKREENRWVATKKHRKDIPFIGSARAGGWRQQLSERSVGQIERSWGALMTLVGYSTHSYGECGDNLETISQRAR
jgi:hypothetical protein